jgi:hypothetical protein
MGGLAKQFMGKSISPEGLMSFFADQKANISDALPRGLSLPDDILPAYSEPRTTRLHTSEHTAYSETRTTSAATPTFPNWLLPLLGLAALFALAYLFWPRGNPEQPGVANQQPRVANQQPEVVRRDVARPPLETTNTKAPDVNLVQDLTGDLSSLTSTLTGIKDLASARSAVPQLTELATKLDGMKALVNKLPSVGKTEVTNLIKSNVDPLLGQLNRVLMIPGASDLLRPVLERITGSVAMLGGIQPAQFALPGIDVTKVGSSLSTALTSLTETLSGIKDSASAEAALPRLREIDGQLDAAKTSIEALPEAGRTTIGALVQDALAKLKDLAGNVLAIGGVGDLIKPVVDAIMTKLAALVA